jgi:hypothetical protein
VPKPNHTIPRQVKGFPLDFCSRYERRGAHRGIGCGQEAADLWCRAHGFRTASSFLTTFFAPNASFCLGDGSVNPADPEDRDSAVGHHTIFVNITCTMAAQGPDEDGELPEPKGELDGEIIMAPVLPGGGDGIGAAEEGGRVKGGLKEAGGVGPSAVTSVVAAAAEAAAVPVRVAQDGAGDGSR